MPGTLYISLTFLNKKGIDIFNRQSMCLGIKLWFEKKKKHFCFTANEVKNAVRSVERQLSPVKLLTLH